MALTVGSNRVLLGGLTGSLWSPAVLGAALVGWWDASDTSTITLNGSNVSAWTSKAGGISASQATGANQPAYSATGFNTSYPAVVNSSGKSLDISSVAAFPLSSSAHTIMAVAQDTNSASTAEYLYGWGAGTSLAARSFAANAASRNGFIDVAVSNLDTGVAVSVPHVIEWVHAGGANGLTQSFYDGNAAATANFTLATTNAAGAIGRWPAFGASWTGPISELIIVTTALPISDRQKMEGYLAWKWGLQGNLPVGHPYKNARP